MNTKLQTIEQQIANKLVADLIAAGFEVSVNDGEETTLKNSRDKAAIIGAMFSTDQDTLLVSHPNRKKGWILLFHGNDRDLISDYTINLEDVIAPINAWIDAK